jgi:ATP-dependent helicase/nuclease subunit B
VDRCASEGGAWLLVYDYKTRAQPLQGRFLTGARLQLASYMLAVQRGSGGRARVVGGFLAPLFPDRDALNARYVQEAAPNQQRLYLYRPYGLLAREAARLLDPDLGPRPSGVARMRLRQDGEFDRTQSRDVVEQAALDERLALAERTILQAAEGVLSGTVEAAPLVENHTLACKRCDFRPVCRFDRALNRPRAAEAVLPTLEVRDESPEEAGS